MRRAYSRLATVEEKRNLRRAIFYIFLTIVSLVFLFTFGLPTLVKFTGFLSDLKKGGQPIDKNDTTPPAPPQIDPLPEFTNQTTVKISGRTESGATIKYFLNNSESEILSDKDGNFSIDFGLKDGENNFLAQAKDSAGNESQKTQTYKIFFDNKPPDLEMVQPQDGAEFFGSKQRQIVIKGKTETEAQVIINDRPLAVDANGKFLFTTTLSEGENQFTIKAQDAAGNSSEIALTVRFTP